jgi:hypothetical protein
MQKLYIIIAALLVVSLNSCSSTGNSSTTQTATSQETTGVRVNAGSQSECEQQGAVWDKGVCQI